MIATPHSTGPAQYRVMIAHGGGDMAWSEEVACAEWVPIVAKLEDGVTWHVWRLDGSRVTAGRFVSAQRALTLRRPWT